MTLNLPGAWLPPEWRCGKPLAHPDEEGDDSCGGVNGFHQSGCPMLAGAPCTAQPCEWYTADPSGLCQEHRP